MAHLEASARKARIVSAFLPLLAALALATLVMAGWTSTVAAEPRAELLLDPRGDIGVDERVQITIKIDSPGQSRTAPPRFQLENLQIVSGPSQSTSIQVINGAMSQSQSFLWLAQPQKLGRARIHSAVIDVDGQRLELPPVEIQVVENPPPRQARRSNDPFDRLFRNDPFFQRDPAESFFEQRRRRQQEPSRAPQLFLEAVVDDSKPWIGEQLVYTLYLYTEVNVRSASATKLPDFKGFWTEVIPLPENNEPEMLERDGRRMARLPLLQRALFPRQSGPIEIGPVEAAMTVLTGDGIFSLAPVQSQITRASNIVKVVAQAMPPGPPPGFRDVVGQLSFDAKIEPRSLEVGQAATLELRLTGKGHLQGVAAPDIPTIAGLQVFPPQQSGGDSLKRTTILGNRIWTYVLVPDRAGKIAIPKLDFPYFDPVSGLYKVASTAPLELEVNGSTQAVRSSADNVALHPIRPNALPAAAISAPRRKLWPFLLMLLPWVAVLLWRARRKPSPRRTAQAQAGEAAPRTGTSFPPGTALTPRSEAPPSVGRPLSQSEVSSRLEEALSEKKPRQAAGLFEGAWREFLAERVGLPPGTPMQQWREHLLHSGTSLATAEDLGRLTQDLHYLRYAPELSSTDELRADLLDRSRRLLKALA